MEINQLRSFCAVVETGSFTEAGRRTHRAQSTISIQIARLEEAFGERLLDRLPRGVIPTPSGKILHRYARKILDLMDESRDEILKVRETLRGNLVIGASTIPATYILPNILGNFIRCHPGMTSSVQISNSRDVIRRVLDRSLDIGFTGKMVSERGLQYMELVEDKIELIVPRGHPWSNQKVIPLDRIPSEPFISREMGSGTRSAVEAALRERGIPGLRTVIQVSSTEAAKRCVVAGLGFTFLSEHAIDSDDLAAVKVEGLTIQRHFYAVVHKENLKRRSIQAFLEFVSVS